MLHATRSAAFTTISASASPTAAISAASTACRRRTCSSCSRSEILDFEEIERFARIAAGLGVDKLRVTGGEPLLRRDLPVLIERLAAIPGIRDLALTTNGVLLPELARPLYEAGLRRINVHIDTLDRERFRQITRRDDLPKVLAGLEACKAARLSRQAERGRGEEPGGAGYRAAGALSRGRTASRCGTSSSCRSTRRICGTAARCCWRTT